MDRNQGGNVSNLMDREGRIVAEILERFRNLMMAATERISSTASPGEAAFNSMRMDMEASALTRSCEDLLSLTRQIRELWVVGPLRRVGEGEREAEAAIAEEVAAAEALITSLRERARLTLVDGGDGDGTGEYRQESAEDAAVAVAGAAGGPIVAGL